MEIRRMRQGDEAKVYDPVCRSLDEYFSPEVISYFMMQWPAGQIVACDFMGRIIGYLAGSRLPNGRAAVSLFCVDSSVRGKGAGSSILNYFRQVSMMEGYRELQLEVKVGNVSAIEFYRRRGFVQTEYLECFYNDGSDGIRMVSTNSYAGFN